MKRKGALWAIAVTIAVIGLLYLTQYTGWHSSDIAGPGKILREVTWPAQMAVKELDDKLRDFFGYFRDNTVLRRENEELRHSLSAAEYWIQQMKELREENLRLGELLDFQTTHNRLFDLVIARVIGKGGDNWSQTVIIDRGSLMGLACDMAVLAPAGMVGRVISVTPHTAEILLLIDRESAIGARIMETRFAPGLVAGTGQDDRLEMLKVDHDAEMSPGQTVITSGYGSVFPKGLVIGTVDKVALDPDGLTKSASVLPAVDFRRLEEVMVVRGLHENYEDIHEDVMSFSVPPDIRPK